jgi:isopenicillin N synthase-like dioxygenase
MSLDTIAVLDLRDFLSGDRKRHDRFVAELGESLKEFGFFAIGYHGVDQSLIELNYALMEKFFALPLAVKKSYEVEGGGGQRGYTSFGKEHAKDSPFPDLKEFWHVGREVPAGHYLEKVYQKNIWIREIAEYKEASLQLMHQLDQLASHTLRALAIYLGEKENVFEDLIQYGNSILRTIHYPAIPEDAHPQSVRAGAHEDINLITILCESTAPGLELLRRDGSWLPIHAQKGYMVIDSGDMMARITNEVIPATTHRVVNPDNSRERRFSMPYFVHPKPDASLACFKSCVTANNPLRYPPILADEFLTQRLEEIGLIKK